MDSVKSYRLTKEEYNYLLPAISRNKLLYRGNANDYSLIVDEDDLEDVLNRLQGFYGRFDMLPIFLSYKCFRASNIDSFRRFVK